MKTVNLREVPLSEIIDLPINRWADCFPMLERNPSKRDEGKTETLTLSELADSINKNGLQEAIVLYHGTLLDGRNRRAACEMAAKALKVDPSEFIIQVEDFEGTEDEAKEFVKALNLDRRDLKPTSRAVSALKWWDVEAAEAKSRQGTRTDLGNITPNLGGSSKIGETAEILASEFRVSKGYIEDARREQRQELEARRRSEEAAQRAEEYELAEIEAMAALEAAKEVADTEKIREAASKINSAQNHKIEEREKAAELATEAAKHSNLLAQLHEGKKNISELRRERKGKPTEDDPMGQSRLRANQHAAGLVKEIKEQAILSDRGSEAYNYLGNLAQRICNTLQEEFDILLDFECYDEIEEV